MWTNPAQFVIQPSTSWYTGVPVSLSATPVTNTIVSRHTWYFGDGVVATESAPSHTFQYPGVYDIVHVVCDFSGNTYSTQATLSVADFAKDAVSLTPSSSSCNVVTPYTWQVSVTATSEGPHVVQLHSENSASVPASNPRKLFDHLVPMWGFYSAHDQALSKPIASVTVDTLPVTVNGTTVAYRGSTCVQYKDDMPGQPTLWATLQVPYASNTRTYAASTVTIHPLTADHILVTADGSAPVSPTKWCGGNIPVVVTLCATVSGASKTLFHLASAGDISVTLSSNAQLTGADAGALPATVSISHTDDRCLPTGAFYKDLLTSSASATSVVITANALSLSASSAAFDILPFFDNYQFRVFNESYDVAATIKQHAPPSIVLKAPKLFDEYLPGAIGTPDENDPMVMGVRMFERIANFVQTHGDIDTCGVDQLLSFATSMDVPFDDYGLVYPPEVKRLVDVMSVNYHRLRGARCNCILHFRDCEECCDGDACPRCGKQLTLNRSANALNCTTHNVTAGTDLVYVSVGDQQMHYLHTVPLQDGTTVYPISAIDYGPLEAPYCTNYTFFNYVSSEPGNQLEGVISWDDCRTLLPEDATYTEWFQDGGLIERMFDYVLHAGLGLVDTTVGCPVPDIACTTPDPCL